MKQHTLPQQTSELSDQAEQKLGKWLDGHGYLYRKNKIYSCFDNSDPIYDLSCYGVSLSIGQMIEFLQDHENDDYMLEQHAVLGKYGEGGNPELADALWEACKSVLEEGE